MYCDLSSCNGCIFFANYNGFICIGDLGSRLLWVYTMAPHSLTRALTTTGSSITHFATAGSPTLMFSKRRFLCKKGSVEYGYDKVSLETAEIYIVFSIYVS